MSGPDGRLKRQNSRKVSGRSVGVLLSGHEKFSPHYGGATARWVYEVYSRLTDDLKVEVLGFPTSDEDRYPVLAHRSSTLSAVCALMGHLPLLRRYEDSIWLGSLMGRMEELDVLHINNRPQWMTVLRRLGYRGKLVLHLHNDHLGHWTTSMLDALAPTLDAVAVCSGYLRDTFVPKSAALAAKTTVVFNGVNTQLFVPRPELRERKTIFFVGRFDREKGVLELVKAYSRLLKSHPDAKLVVGGSTGFGTHKETAYVRQVRETAAAVVRDGGNLEFVGYLHHEKDLPVWFQRATIFVCPSLFQEPFGLVNAEAMACATPVVGAKRGGIPEVLGDCGVLVEPEDTDDFAGAMSALLSSPETCARLGKAGHERCLREFDWNTTANNWASLLEVACTS